MKDFPSSVRSIDSLARSEQEPILGEPRGRKRSACLCEGRGYDPCT